MNPPESPIPEIVQSGESGDHRCKVCSRSFSSGKALGGHVSSAHTQAANRDHSQKKLKPEIKDSGRHSGLHACGVCAKRFQSQKSLYGHMRCHPNRSRRGMEPPTDPGSDTYSVPDQDEEGSDHNDRHPSLDIPWLMKGRRGRAGNAFHVPIRSLSSEQAEISVGQQLLKLPEKEVVEDNFRKRKRESESESEEDLFQAAVSVLANGRRQMNSSYLKSQEKLSPAEMEGLGLSSKHVCGTCNKSFRSPQALGGHMSSHNKHTRMNIVDSVDNNLWQSVHVCVVCEKSFSSGQALGGHMKSHNNIKKNHGIGDGSSKGAEEKANVSVRDLDLNMMPHAEEDEDI